MIKKEKGFNKNSRTKNVILTSSIGLICTLINTILGFGYRTFFIKVLSAQYLGISGLFSNILDLLSLANLGIMTSISFRMYKPIAQGDSEKVGQLMRFTRYVYYFVAGFIFVVGMALMPFLEFFIKDLSEVPSDVNLYLAYFMYLMQMVASYLYTYKLNILIADQKKYQHSLIQCCLNLVKYGSQIVVLFITRNFMLTLIVGIASTIVVNIIFSVFVQNQYKEVFKTKTNLSKQERKQIFGDSFATMCHKVGYTVINSTDSLLVSKYIGLAITGLYSNYLLILNSLKTFLEPVLSNITASIGNAHFTMDSEKHYQTYKRLLFMNLSITGLCTFCLFMLIDDFILAWLGEGMSLDSFTVIALCLEFYLQTGHYISESYVQASGLFNKDKIRPLIEAIINIVVSIILAKLMGLAGIFIGTIVAHLCTVFHREPYILYKYEFKKDKEEYWQIYCKHFFLTIFMCIVGVYLRNLFAYRNEFISLAVIDPYIYINSIKNLPELFIEANTNLPILGTFEYLFYAICLITQPIWQFLFVLLLSIVLFAIYFFTNIGALISVTVSTNIFTWFLQAIFFGILYMCVLIVCYKNSDEYRYFYNFFNNKFNPKGKRFAKRR